MRASLSFLLVLFTACGGPSARESSAKIVREEELPPREREVWQHYHTGGAAWELERETVRADPELSRFLVDNLVREMVKNYDRSRLSRPGQQQGPFERARAELVLLDARSVPVLVELLAVGDGIVAFLAGDVLVSIGELAVDPVAAKLQDPGLEVRRRAAELLARLPLSSSAEPQVEERLGALVEADAAWIVRAQAAQTLGVRGARNAHKGYAAAVLSKALADPDPAVVESAAKALRALGEPRAFPFVIDGLERAVRRGELAGVRAAQETLRSLSGVKRDLDVEQWRQWWRQEGEARLVPH